ncbi:MAG: hypothetical protein GYA39_05930 [Methanothrix sp.]|nr:hypothetical protein [Methanothrix sp.]
MIYKLMAHRALILLLIVVGLSWGQLAIGSSNETVLAGDGAPHESANAASNFFSLNYIWSVSGLEPGQVIMALNQNGKDLYGAAKYEPDSGQAWNAVVVGSIFGDSVVLTLTSLKDDEQVSSMMTGTFDSVNQTLKGSFFQTSCGNISSKGTFSAIWINPETSSFTPAKVEGETRAATANGESTAQAASQASSQTSRFHDVHQDADRILTGVGDISQIPIGMGGSGLP